MTGLVTALVAAAGAVLLLGLLVSIVLGRRKRSAAAARRHAQGVQHGSRPSVPVPVVRGPAPVEQRRPASRIAFAEPGMRGPLFQYGGDGPGFEVDAPFAVVALATTGFSPANGDRIVEIAIARVDGRGACTTSTRRWSTPAATSGRCSSTASPPATSAAPPPSPTSPARSST